MTIIGAGKNHARNPKRGERRLLITYLCNWKARLIFLAKNTNIMK
jgi:hypothetical protein